MVRNSQARQKNVSFVQMRSLGSRSEMKLYGLVVDKALQTIDTDTEQYLRYGKKNMFANVACGSQSQYV